VHSFHVFTILTDSRDALSDYLKNNGVEAGIHYPKIIPDQKCYNENSNTEQYTNARRFANSN